MYVYISGNTEREVAAAKRLCDDLLISVRADIQKVIPRYLASSKGTGSGYNNYAVGTGGSFIVQAPAPPKEKPPPMDEFVPPPPPPSTKPPPPA